MAVRHDGPDTDENPKVDTERVRRMKAMMRRLHADELEPKKQHIPEVKARSLIIAGSLIAVILFAMSALYNYNVFVNLKERVLSTRGHVESALQRRSNLFVNLVNLTLNHALLEEEVFGYVADVRTRIDQTNQALNALRAEATATVTMDPASLSDMQGALSRLMALVEQYPDIKSSETYQQLMEKLVEIENYIFERRTAYNDAVYEYNKKITNFPWIMLAQTTGFTRFDYFQANADTQENPIATRKTFQRLLPESLQLGATYGAPRNPVTPENLPIPKAGMAEKKTEE